jgi:hypothetical protein
MLVMGVCQKCIAKVAKKSKRKNIKWSGADSIDWYENKVSCPFQVFPGMFKQTEVLGPPPPWCEFGLEHAVIFARTKKYRLMEMQEIKKTMKQKRGG